MLLRVIYGQNSQTEGCVSAFFPSYLPIPVSASLYLLLTPTPPSLQLTSHCFSPPGVAQG